MRKEQWMKNSNGWEGKNGVNLWCTNISLNSGQKCVTGRSKDCSSNIYDIELW